MERVSESLQDRPWGQEAEGLLIGGPSGHLGFGATVWDSPGDQSLPGGGAPAISSPPGRLPCSSRASLYICFTRGNLVPTPIRGLREVGGGVTQLCASA